jgi:hypothetical protein
VDVPRFSDVIVIETVFDPPLTDEEHNRVGERIDRCASMRSARWMRSYLSVDRKQMLCEFEAPDVDAVRDAYRSAGVSFVRAWKSELYARA